MILLTTDWHLDDNSANEYRWKIFQSVGEAIIEHNIEHVYHLGDLVDRKDRHSGALVNRLIGEFKFLLQACPITILRGNHDTPLRSPAYWEFLPDISRDLRYITAPSPNADLLLLPFSANPKADWQGLDFSKFKAIFMHATVTGAISENGTKLTNNEMPLLPRGIRIYSGDVHTPQEAGGVIYVGAPHPCNFGHKHPCRMLMLDDNYKIAKQIDLNPMRKHVFEINHTSELIHCAVNPGDQVRIRLKLSSAQSEQWAVLQENIVAWAKEQQVQIVQVDPTVDTPLAQRGADLEMSPEAILRDFAAEEKIDEDLLAIGLELLAEAK